MRCKISFESGRSTFSYTASPEDESKPKYGQFISPQFRILKDLKDVHPDILNLVAILSCHPWIAKSLESNIPCSPAMAEAVQLSLRIELTNVDQNLVPRRKPRTPTLGMAYSGGADCTAGMAVAPMSTRAYFLERVTEPHKEWRGLYRKDAALHSIAELAEKGFAVRSMKTDLEFMRNPVGFPHDLANIIPALVHAEEDSLTAISWGAILESTYRIGAGKFRDYSGSPFINQFSGPFNAVGLDVANIVAGVSEVGTAIICHKSGFDAFAQSCMRGQVRKPCRNCWKCARKSLVDCAIEHKWPTGRDIESLFSSREARIRLTDNPVKHEGVVAYALYDYAANALGSSDILDAALTKCLGYNVSPLERHYLPALDFIPQEFRDTVKTNIEQYLPAMSSDDENVIENWPTHQLLKTQSRIKGQNRLLEIFDISEGEVTVV